MKKIIALSLFYFFTCSTFAQSNDVWIAFPNKDTTLTGFKDKNGVIKIEPKFSGFTTAREFENIIAVSEEKNNKWESYYLTKKGKVVGRDSLYVFDNSPDCENEGFIRFTDGKTDKMGIFNGDGKIVIPAVYNVVSKVHNGMISVLKDAKKERDPLGEHFFWSGGKELLIDLNNKILIDNFKSDNNLNYYSVEKTATPTKDQTRESFRGVDGQYYSFINYEKEFKNWLKNTLLSDLSQANLEKHSFDTITYWKEPDGWLNASKSKFIAQNYIYLKLKLEELKNPKTDYFVSFNGLNPFIFESDDYRIYFNNCNESKDWIYPTMDIVINPKKQTDHGQDHFDFVRTDNGYKLINVSSRTNILK